MKRSQEELSASIRRLTALNRMANETEELAEALSTIPGKDEILPGTPTKESSCTNAPTAD